MTIGSIATIPLFAGERVIDTPYEYPIVPGTSEWAELEDFPSKIEACQIPENILNNISTEALVETVLNYPLFKIYFSYDKATLYDWYKNIFNGIQELETREDAGNYLLNFYQQENYRKNRKSTQKQEDKSTYCEILLSEEKYLENLSENQLNDMEQILTEKLETETDPPLYFQILGEKQQPLASEPVPDWPDNYTTTVVYTPLGSKPVTVRRYLGEISDNLINQYKDYYAQIFPAAVHLSTGTTLYNCHSYAWYSQSTTNKFWMPDPSPYMKPGCGYVQYYPQNYSVPETGLKVFYDNKSVENNHSAVITGRYSGSVNSGYNYNLVKCVSKWGQGALYEHRLVDNPWTTSKYSPPNSDIRFYKRVYS